MIGAVAALAAAGVRAANRYELVVNRKAAVALGISLPTAFVLRADRVVD